MESYTFLYVPYNPLEILVNCNPFVHVPYTFLHILYSSSTNSVKGDMAIQLPEGLSSCAWSPPNVAVLFPFLYVPLYVPIRSWTLHTHQAICGGLSAHTPISTYKDMQSRGGHIQTHLILQASAMVRYLSWDPPGLRIR